MRKYYLSFALFFTMLSFGLANPIGFKKALEIAKHYANVEAKQSGSLRAVGATGNDAPYFVFNKQEGGYIIVTGESGMTEVVGYSDQGTFSPNQISPELASFLHGYANYIGLVRSGKAKAYQQTLRTISVVVSPLIKTMWDQGAPYDSLVPTYTAADGKKHHYPTGCVATAMCQIMRYYKWPLVGKGHNSDTVKSHGRHIVVSADFSKSKYDWDNMLLDYNVKNVTDAQKIAVAKLMYDAGVSVDMDYDTPEHGGSASYVEDASQAFNNNFGYVCTYQSRSQYSTAEFIKMIKNELDNKRPVLYTGAGLGGGHAWVVDGYESNGFFHCNWGWGGLSNGYFNLNYMDPSNLGTGGGSGGFSSSQSILILQPNKSGVSTPILKPSLILTSGGKLAHTRKDSLTLSNVTNFSGVTFEGEIGLVFEKDGKRTYWTDGQSQIKLDNNRWFKGPYFQFDISKVLSGYTDGIYNIYPAYKIKGDDKHFYLFKTHIILVIKGGVHTYTEFIPTLQIADNNYYKPTKTTIGRDNVLPVKLLNNSEENVQGNILITFVNKATKKVVVDTVINANDQRYLWVQVYNHASNMYSLPFVMDSARFEPGTYSYHLSVINPRYKQTFDVKNYNNGEDAEIVLTKDLTKIPKNSPYLVISRLSAGTDSVGLNRMTGLLSILPNHNFYIGLQLLNKGDKPTENYVLGFFMKDRADKSDKPKLLYLGSIDLTRGPIEPNERWGYYRITGFTMLDTIAKKDEDTVVFGHTYDLVVRAYTYTLDENKKKHFKLIGELPSEALMPVGFMIADPNDQINQNDDNMGGDDNNNVDDNNKGNNNDNNKGNNNDNNKGNNDNKGNKGDNDNKGNNQNTGGISISPQYSNGKIMIKGDNVKMAVLYTLGGSVVKMATGDNVSYLDITGIQHGFYILKIEVNSKTKKFYKLFIR